MSDANLDSGGTCGWWDGETGDGGTPCTAPGHGGMGGPATEKS